MEVAYDDFAWGETSFYGVLCLEATNIPLNSGYRDHYTFNDNTNNNCGTITLQENHQLDSKGHAVKKKDALHDFHEKRKYILSF